MRLIDAHALILIIKDAEKDVNVMLRGEQIIDLIESAPTAYDVDKVCEELFESGFCHEDYDEHIIKTNDAIKIVKSGGVSDE